MFKSTWAKSLPDFFLFALALSIPFPFIYGAICIVLLTLSWLLTADFKTTVLNLKSRKMLWPWIIYFLLHAISYSYSDNKAQSTFDLQTKLSILLLPLVIGAGLSLTQKTVERVCFSFTIGISVVAVICIAQAVMLWRETGSTETFFITS